MNFIRVFDNVFWEDEGFTIRLAKMSVVDMINATANDVHPPLYYLFVQFLYRIFGDNGITYHLSGFLPYFFIIVISCTIIKKEFSNIPAVVVITMSSLMKNAVRYNVEARMYSLGALFIFISFFSFYKVIKKNELISWFVFVASSLGAAYTHYYALISVAFFYIMLLPKAKNSKKYLTKTIISYFVTFIAYIPWLIFLLKSFKRTADSWWLNEIPTINECIDFLLDYKWLAVGTLIVITFFVLYDLGLMKIEYSKKEKFFERFNFVFSITEKVVITPEIYWVISGIISFLGTIAVGLTLSYMVRPFFVVRYLFPLSAVLYLIIGYCVSKMNFKKIWSIVLILAILWNNIPVYINIYKAESYLDRQTTIFLSNVKPAEDAVLLTNNPHLSWTLLEYYYPENDIEYVEELSSINNSDYDDAWIFWTEEIDEYTANSFREEHYQFEEIYEGLSSDGLNCFVYNIRRNK